MAFVTLAQASEGIEANTLQPIANPSADTLVYYMGRKDAAKIAKQLMESSPNHTGNTPVHILEAVSTHKERHWESTLQALADGRANDWFDPSSPALILIGQALETLQTQQSKEGDLECPSPKINNGLQDSQILPHSRRSA